MFNFNDIPPSYLKDLVEFLISFSWTFKVFNTQYIKSKILQDHKNFLNLFENKINNFINLTEGEKHSDEINNFIEKINYFKINFDEINTDDWKCRNTQNKLSIKKLYEIENIGKLINEEFESDLDVLVDLGSGLGYLDEFLHVNHNFKIIGLEGCEKNHLKAIERQQKYYKKSFGLVKHLQHFVTIESSDFIIKEAKKLLKFQNDVKIGLFGLHPCGDLSIVSIELFLRNVEIKSLIISPCCYHRMTGIDEEFSGFNYFPLSMELKEILKR